MVEVSGAFLLPSPLVSILLLQLERLHLCCELLYLLSQSGTLLLVRTLHVLLDGLALTMTLIRHLCFLLDSMILHSEHAVALFEVLGTCPTVFKGEL